MSQQPNPPTFRPWLSTDMSSIAKIEQQPQVHGWSQQQFFEAFQAHYLGWVIEQENTVIGFLIASCVLDEAEILNVAIANEQRRHGYGKALLNHALQALQQFGSTTCWLEVRASNQTAIGLYEQSGFKRTGIRKNYYAGPDANHREDALLYMLALASQ